MWKDKVKEIIYILENSDIEEIDITFWGKRIRVSKSGSVIEGSVSPTATAVQSSSIEAPEATPASAPPAETGGEQILSPMPGTFYRAASPESDPFINEGDTVKKGQTLCIIEAMKMMNQIASDANGIIERVLVQNGDPVEYGQVLFLISPD